MNVCENIQAELSAYLDGELREQARAACEAHLRECASCRAVLEDLKDASAALAGLPKLKAPPALAARLREEVLKQPPPQDSSAGDSEPAPAKAWDYSLWRPVLLGFAAIMLLSVIAFVLLPASQPSTSSRVAEVRAPAPASPQANVVPAPTVKSEPKNAGEVAELHGKFGKFAPPPAPEPIPPPAPAATQPAEVASGFADAKAKAPTVTAAREKPAKDKMEKPASKPPLAAAPPVPVATTPPPTKPAPGAAVAAAQPAETAGSLADAKAKSPLVTPARETRAKDKELASNTPPEPDKPAKPAAASPAPIAAPAAPPARAGELAKAITNAPADAAATAPKGEIAVADSRAEAKARVAKAEIAEAELRSAQPLAPKIYNFETEKLSETPAKSVALPSEEKQIVMKGGGRPVAQNAELDNKKLEAKQSKAERLDELQSAEEIVAGQGDLTKAGQVQAEKNLPVAQTDVMVFHTQNPDRLIGYLKELAEQNSARWEAAGTAAADKDAARRFRKAPADEKAQEKPAGPLNFDIIVPVGLARRTILVRLRELQALDLRGLENELQSSLARAQAKAPASGVPSEIAALKDREANESKAERAAKLVEKEAAREQVAAQSELQAGEQAAQISKQQLAQVAQQRVSKSEVRIPIHIEVIPASHAAASVAPEAKESKKAEKESK